MRTDRPNGDAPRIVLVGGGRLAQSIARTMPDAVRAVLLRDPASAHVMRELNPNIMVAGALADIDPAAYDLLWIVTGDSAISEVSERLASERESWRGVAVVHSSGATSPRVLDPFARQGALTFALHPNGSFTGEEPIPSGLLWSISTNDPTALSIAHALLDRVSPHIVPIDDAMRPLYHAAASVASNYSVALFGIAVELYKRAGLSDADARAVAARFIADSAERAAHAGALAALTGPIARGDDEVYHRQRDAVAHYAADYLDAFKAMARATASLAGRELDEGEDRSSEDQSRAAMSGTPEAQSGQDSEG